MKDTLVIYYSFSGNSKKVAKPVSINLGNYSKIVLITGTWWYGITPIMKK